MSRRLTYEVENSTARHDGGWWVSYADPEDGGRIKSVVCPRALRRGDRFEIIRDAAVPLEPA